jgi:Zn ribbon nucleic-acid-binding protein
LGVSSNDLPLLKPPKHGVATESPEFFQVIRMSARNRCPRCHSTRVDEVAVLTAPNVDFIQCHECGALWHVDKGRDDPASQELLGKVKVDARLNWVRR